MAKAKIIIGADHAGFPLKEAIKPLLAEAGLDVTDAGTNCEMVVPDRIVAREREAALQEWLQFLCPAHIRLPVNDAPRQMQGQGFLRHSLHAVHVAAAASMSRTASPGATMRDT